MIQVSIVIVCMNNLKNLYPCLNSIKAHTAVKYEVLVVAYLFSDENYDKVVTDFPWVKFIRSSEIRGFSENNNLALRIAQGTYCFVVNDDTEIKMNTIDQLVSTMESLPESVAIVSPKFLNADGSVQVCGRDDRTRTSFFKNFYHIPCKKKTPYKNQSGVFETKQILGAGFLIKRDVFESIGWFDESYFFSPEDMDVARKVRRMGLLCFVDANAEIYHYEGMTSRSLSLVSTATRPASVLGNIIYYGEDSFFWCPVVRFHQLLGSFARFSYHRLLSIGEKKPSFHSVWADGYWNAFCACFSSMSPKEAFIKYYNAIKK